MIFAALALGTSATLLSGCDKFYEVTVSITGCEDGKPLPNAQCAFKLEQGIGEDPATVNGTADGLCRYHANEPPSSSFKIEASAPDRATRTVTLQGAYKSTLALCLDRR